MTLQLIGAGWGRTGTLSLKLALERLGLRTHHMREVSLHPEQNEQFLAAARGSADWDAIYREYDATVDWPGAAFWRELADAFPEAKVLLSVRPAQEWYDSYDATVRGPVLDGGRGTWSEMVREVIVERDLGGVGDDRAHVVAAFERHNEEVVAAIAPERLLVLQVTHGWRPLCEFLGVPEPDEPFPHENTREYWAARYGSS